MKDDVKKINILIIDEQPVVHCGLSQIFDVQHDFNVVGNSANFTECSERIETMLPDVVVLDLEVGDNYQSIEVSQIQAIDPNIKIIVYTNIDNEEDVNDLIRLGIQGFVVKNSDIQILVQAIRTVNKGEYFLDPAISSKVMLHILDLKKSQQQNNIISTREREVLILIARGYRNKEIASSLFVAESTVKYHISSIFTKLAVSTRIEAVQVGKKKGIL